jgi:hypothetical protein
MELWHQDISVTDIATELNCGLEIVREAVVNGHKRQGLPVPDGRKRRREMRLRREAG